jgi:uncharacterized protein (DUF2225 family)
MKKKNKVSSVWSNYLADEVHNPITRKFRKRRVYVNGIDKTWAADLLDVLLFKTK